ncbi:group III truncated hemoglobin [Seonamhaeicola marinus]|uniref:Group III truncated hemoglobin n=1 Tax=Seonamhaeicola marinus TaxID=1912246 RepID=A0A5D0IN90_9FLAO|nr:group III truncated hemoglobin [Seonamhaeicola marinus]TYA84330.1 group III truncated hemoglobin [Seonamhaeicola marinus]
MEKTEITSIDDIKLMVDSFYTKIRRDSQIAYVFENEIENDWANHLSKMYKFWQTVLFHKKAYRGSPLKPHLDLPIKPEHFGIWLKHFEGTVNNLFIGDIAENAIDKARKMAQMFQLKISTYKSLSNDI